jgi:hypothetical protein
MTVSITSPEGVINLALARIKYPYRIGSIWEGSRAAKAALDCYGQTRDDILRTNDWPFARRDISLTLLKQAPAGGYIPPLAWSEALYPPIPWQYEYTFPSDGLRVRSIRNQDLFLVNYDPREHRFSVTNDNSYTPAQKTIVTNVGPVAIATYTGRLTDPSTFDADFVEALAEELGRRLASVLTDMEAAKVAAENAMRATGEADTTQAG